MQKLKRMLSGIQWREIDGKDFLWQRLFNRQEIMEFAKDRSVIGDVEFGDWSAPTWSLCGLSWRGLLEGVELDGGHIVLCANAATFQDSSDTSDDIEVVYFGLTPKTS